MHKKLIFPERKEVQIKNHVIILYDGIENTVFESQVLIPAQKLSNQNHNVIIISFERNTPKNAVIEKIKQTSIQLFIVKRLPFLGFWSLKRLSKHLRFVLESLQTYTLQARGPQAAYIAMREAHSKNCKNVIVQARGLLAEEFIYSNEQETRWLHKKLFAWRLKKFQQLEQYIYGKKVHSTYEFPITIEAVSPALKEHLIKAYKTPVKKITLATGDIPTAISNEQKSTWRAEIRAQLAIGNNVHIYCYNGSTKPWQCPDQVIEFFKQTLATDQHIFLLILTHDKESFVKIIHKYGIDPAHYYVVSVQHAEVVRYLAACDTGIIFREKHLINWISRPIKLLEYQAASLSIIHNNTIALLTQPIDPAKNTDFYHYYGTQEQMVNKFTKDSAMIH